jgi:hypothetical protein
MHLFSKVAFASIAAALLAQQVVGDVYLHFPPGCNDRNREQNQNRNNDQRLWDSENNGNGGYPYGGSATLTGVTDGYKFYQGSKLRIEWTLQHSCGPDSNAVCTTLLQYMCRDDLRDGYPTGGLVQNQNAGYLKAAFASAGQNQDGTNTIPFPSGLNGGAPAFNVAAMDSATDLDPARTFYNNGTSNGFIGAEFGYHETFDDYLTCVRTRRNTGLYLADRKMGGMSARFTRQNPGGTRHGLECPEERDYYPYWRPTPWIDIAIYASDEDWCKYYEAESENVKPREYCQMTDAQRVASPDQVIPYDKVTCGQRGGTWTTGTAHGVAAPECMFHPHSRDNHLGNAVTPQGESGNDDSKLTETRDPQTAFYLWTIPETIKENTKCVIRLRYNMSSSDYNSMNWAKEKFDPAKDGEFVDWAKNCETSGNDNPANEDDINLNAPNGFCFGKLTADVVPLYNRPFVSIQEGDNPKMGMAYNTNQVGRTFEDRSYVFTVLKKPGNFQVVNFGYRGCRGNIVQCYPAVEYDFVQNDLTIDENTRLHIQFVGSDFTANRDPNNGEGWRFSSRTNMMQSRDAQINFPLPVESATMWKDKETSLAFAYVGMDLSKCNRALEGDNSNTANNDPNNCAKLNPAPARWELPNRDPEQNGLVTFKKGTYHYLSTRNNNFSNRSQKGVLRVTSALNAAELSGVIIGSIVGAGAILAGVVFFARRNRVGTHKGATNGIRV